MKERNKGPIRPTYASLAGSGIGRGAGPGAGHNVGIDGGTPSASGVTHDNTHRRTLDARRDTDVSGRYYSNYGQHNWRDNNYSHNNGLRNNMNGNNNDHNYRYNSDGRYNRPPSRYGSTKYSTDFGVPLPSRHIIIERVKQERTKQDVHDYIKWKNHNIFIRSIKLMSKPGSFYKRYLIEVSLEQFNILRREEFWHDRIRIRNFKGNGKLWKDTEIVQNESEEVTEPTNTNEDTNEDDDEIEY